MRRRAARKSLLLAEETLSPKSAVLGATLFTLAGVFRQRLDFNRAHGLLEQSLAIHKSAVTGDDANTARILGGLGAVELARGNLDAAKGHLLQARRILESTYPKEEVRLPAILSAQASLEEKLRNFSTADALYQEACAVGSKAFGSSSLDFARLLMNYDSYLSSTGQLARAKEIQDQINSIRARHACMHASYSID